MGTIQELNGLSRASKLSTLVPFLVWFSILSQSQTVMAKGEICLDAYQLPSASRETIASVDNWRATHALVELIPDYFTREAVQFALVSLYTLRDLSSMSAPEVAHRRSQLHSMAEIFMSDSNFHDWLIGRDFIDLINRHANFRFSHSKDLERDLKFLKDSGMLQFLKSAPYLARTESLHWWLEKEALPSFPIGRGEGKTAGELNLQWIKHGTKAKLVERIAPALGEKPNLLTSRPEADDEAADFGAGHYCIRDELPIPVPHEAVVHYELDSRARAGTDFKVVFDERDLMPYIVVLNRAALKVVRYGIQ